MSASFGPPGWSDSGPPKPIELPTPPSVPPAAAGFAPPSPTPPPTPSQGSSPVPPQPPAQGRAEVPADRRPFDNRRVKAAILDNVLVALVPIGLLVSGQIVTDGAWIVFHAFALIYYFLSEVISGQTVGKRVWGLRVVAEDGRPATAAQVSARTVLRLIDNSFVGIAVLVLSGRRRMRIGDFLGRTVVVDAVPDPGRPSPSPLTVAYPIAWAGAAFAAFFAIGHHGDTYLARMQEVCETRAQVVAQLPQPLLLSEAMMVTRAEIEVLDEIDPPPERRELHAELVRMRTRWLERAEKALVRAQRRPRRGQSELVHLAEAAESVDARYTQLGLTGCGVPQATVI